MGKGWEERTAGGWCGGGRGRGRIGIARGRQRGVWEVERDHLESEMDWVRKRKGDDGGGGDGRVRWTTTLMGTRSFGVC